jgi:hypothetical protein
MRFYIVPSVCTTRARWKDTIYDLEPGPPKYHPLRGTGGGIRWFGVDPPAYLILEEEEQVDSGCTMIVLPTIDQLDLELGELLQGLKRLQEVNIPIGWLTKPTTCRQLMRGVYALFVVSQRYRYLAGNGRFAFETERRGNLNQISPEQRYGLLTGAQELGYDLSGFGGSDEVQAALCAIATQGQSRSFEMKGQNV